MISRCSRE